MDRAHRRQAKAGPGLSPLAQPGIEDPKLRIVTQGVRGFHSSPELSQTPPGESVLNL